MRYHPSSILSSLCTLALASASLPAQTINTCTTNTELMLFVDAQGNPVPHVLATIVEPTFTNTVDAANYSLEEVYISFANLPDGEFNLYVHVTDHLNGTDEVLSTNDPADRQVRVFKSSGIVSLFPSSGNQNVVVTLGDGNQILRIDPVRTALQHPCLFKAHFGDTILASLGSSSPYIIQTVDPIDNCALSTYGWFRIGDSVPGSDVAGSVFNDVDRDGTHDAGEGPLANWEVRLVTGATSQSAFTDANGNYVFPNVNTGSYTIELVVPVGFDATTSSAEAIQVCGCANQALNEFGAATSIGGCEGHTIGFWRNKHGSELVQQNNILATLPALCIADAAGTLLTPLQNIAAWQRWLKEANAVNMAYMLSAQLAATHCSVLVGNVNPGCRINDPVLGNITIHDLMQQAVNSLCNDGYTPAEDPNRAGQTALKNALDAANNNSNWN